jgi:hypothetical protein
MSVELLTACERLQEQSLLVSKCAIIAMDGLALPVARRGKENIATVDEILYSFIFHRFGFAS